MGLALRVNHDEQRIKCSDRSIFLLANDLVATWSAYDWCSVAVFCKQTPPAFQAIGDQGTACDSCLNGAPRFMSMSAIAKPAKRSQFGYFSKESIYTVGNITHIKRSYSWRIYDPAAA
jgi:hypothetical protein